MSKTKKALKRKREAEANSSSQLKKRPGADNSKSKTTNGPPTPPSATEGTPIAADQPVTLSSVVSEEEVEITVETLRALAEHPAAIKSRACKDLRSAVFDFRQACTTGVNAATASGEASLTARVEAAMVDEKYTDAVVLLAEMRIRGVDPKLGALCRWVRHLDAVSGLSMRGEEGTVAITQVHRTPRQLEILRALDAVLRVTGTTDLNPETLSLDNISGPLALQKLWDLRPSDWSPIPVRQNVLDGSIQTFCPPGVKENFHILETTPGPQRKPPNLHDAILYSTTDNAVPLSSSPDEASSTEQQKITQHLHPHVPHLSLLRNVLSPSECQSLIAATESVGFLPDSPLRDDGSETSILAHNVYWLIDPTFHSTLFSRVLPFLPSSINGRRPRSINRRFRVYRYVPGAEYRCHYDGAWPPSGTDPKTGKYQWDSSPEGDKQSSLFTFLLYLNDEFEGGETTFFTPHPGREGVMNAHPVRPVMGSVALFPHGESRGALLHEGTGVRKGAKYIVRTDVEYDLLARVE